MTKHVVPSIRIAAGVLAIFALTSCAGSDSAGGASPMDASSAGSGGTAGMSATSAPASGGHTATAGSGGVQPVAGSGETGGSPPTGGSSSNGGSTGGASGGTSSAGGFSAAGGASGGAPNTAGFSATGGVTTAGGSSGGSSAKGGTTVVGGATATGGATNAGGSTGGSKPVGGATGGTTAGGATSAGSNTHTGVWKVMMLGNSITGSTCYPQVLSEQLIAGQHTNFQFVGTVTNNQSCGANAPSVKTEGHGGYGVTYLPSTSTRGKCDKQPQGCGSYAELQTWAAEACDIVLMHFATNDVWDGRATTEILSSFVAVITEFRKNNPNVIFFVSKIIKLNPSGCGSCLTNVAALAAALTPAWATTNSTPSSPVYIIDHYDSGVDPSTDTADGVHPNLTGATKMATTSYNALVASGYF
jgi:hypothetical protein